jgi:hypothetical protein
MRVVGLTLLCLTAGLAFLGIYFVWDALPLSAPIAENPNAVPESGEVANYLPWPRKVLKQEQESSQAPGASEIAKSIEQSPLPSPPSSTHSFELRQDERPAAPASKPVEAPRPAPAEKDTLSRASDRSSESSGTLFEHAAKSGRDSGGGEQTTELTPINEPNRERARIEENRRALEQLPKGKIVLTGPSTMKVSETRTVHANVGVNVPIDTLRKHVRPGNQTAEGALAVSSKMIAVLNGSGFKINRRTPEEQSVAEGYPTVWSWDVEAKETGDQELEATLYALIGGDTSSRQLIDSYTHKISVSVTPQTWGEWLKSLRDQIDVINGLIVTLSGIVTGVMGWLVLYLDRRKRKSAPAAAAEPS